MSTALRIQPGDAEVELESWETGEVVKVQLDATKTPVQVSEALYKRARKLRRAVQAVQPLLEAVQGEVAYLEEVESSLAGLAQYTEPEDFRALQEVQEELVQQGYLKPDPAALTAKGAAKVKKAAKRAEKAKKSDGTGGGDASASGFRTYTSPSGLQILIGRNNRQNDELSNRIANPNDVWMHVRGIPGSHAIIRVPSSKTPVVPPDEDIQFCANLAAYHSKSRDSGKVDVIVALAAHLKKPKGAKPGQILVTKELRNVVARPSLSVDALVAQK